MIRILIVDDDAACCDGLSQILALAGDMELVGVAACGDDAFKLGRQTRPDVVLIDADLPGQQCLETMRKLAGASDYNGSGPSFVCLAVYPDQHEAAIQAGAARFMPKDGSRQALVAAIRETVAIAKTSRQVMALGPGQPCEIRDNPQ